jgi:hypothetical protein
VSHEATIGWSVGGSLVGVPVELVRKLVAAGRVGERDLKAALLRHVNARVPLLAVLLANGIAESALEIEWGADCAAELPLAVNRPVLDGLPSGLCAFFLAVPLLGDEQTLTFAVADPGDAHLLAELCYQTGREICLRYAPADVIGKALRDAGFSTSQLPPAIDTRGTTERPLLLVPRTSRAARAAKGAPVVDEEGRPTNALSSKVLRASFARKSGNRRGRSESAAPKTAAGPYPTETPAQVSSIDTVLDAMRLAATRDEVIDCLLIGMSTVAARVAVFACRKTGFRGVACNAGVPDSARLRELEIPLTPPTVLTIAAARAGAYLGPLPATSAHEILRAVLGDCPHDVMATAVRVGGRPAVVLFADELSDSLLAAQRGQILATAAGDALSRVVAVSKSERRGLP